MELSLAEYERFSIAFKTLKQNHLGADIAIDKNETDDEGWGPVPISDLVGHASEAELFIAAESFYSMAGAAPPVTELVASCKAALGSPGGTEKGILDFLNNMRAGQKISNLLPDPTRFFRRAVLLEVQLRSLTRDMIELAPTIKRRVSSASVRLELNDKDNSEGAVYRCCTGFDALDWLMLQDAPQALASAIRGHHNFDVGDCRDDAMLVVNHLLMRGFIKPVIFKDKDQENSLPNIVPSRFVASKNTWYIFPNLGEEYPAESKNKLNSIPTTVEQLRVDHKITASEYSNHIPEGAKSHHQFGGKREWKLEELSIAPHLSLWAWSKKLKTETQIRHSLGEFCGILIIFAIFLVVIFGQDAQTGRFDATESLEQAFLESKSEMVSGGDKDFTLLDIKTVEHFWIWINTVWVGQIWTEKNRYTGAFLPKEQRYYVKDENKIIASPRLDIYFGGPSNCEAVGWNSPHSFYPDCKTKNFANFPLNLSRSNFVKKGLGFVEDKENCIDMYEPVPCTRVTMPVGNPSSSLEGKGTLNGTLEIMKELEQLAILGKNTLAIELTVFTMNLNTAHAGYVRLIFEKTDSGAIVPYPLSKLIPTGVYGTSEGGRYRNKLIAFRLHYYSSMGDIGRGVLEGFLVLCTLYYFVYEIRGIRSLVNDLQNPPGDGSGGSFDQFFNENLRHTYAHGQATVIPSPSSIQTKRKFKYNRNPDTNLDNETKRCGCLASRFNDINVHPMNRVVKEKESYINLVWKALKIHYSTLTNVLDLIIILLLIASCTLMGLIHWSHPHPPKEYIGEVSESDYSTFQVPYSWMKSPAGSDSNSIDVVQRLVLRKWSINGFLIILFVAKCFIYLDNFPGLDVFTKTLHRSARKLVDIAVMFFIILFTFALTGVYYYGYRYPFFENLQVAIGSMLDITVQEQGYRKELEQGADAGLGFNYFFYYTWTIVVTMIIINMFMAIVLSDFDAQAKLIEVSSYQFIEKQNFHCFLKPILSSWKSNPTVMYLLGRTYHKVVENDNNFSDGLMQTNENQTDLNVKGKNEKYFLEVYPYEYEVLNAITTYNHKVYKAARIIRSRGSQTKAKGSNRPFFSKGRARQNSHLNYNLHLKQERLKEHHEASYISNLLVRILPIAEPKIINEYLDHINGGIGEDILFADNLDGDTIQGILDPIDISKDVTRPIAEEIAKRFHDESKSWFRSWTKKSRDTETKLSADFIRAKSTAQGEIDVKLCKGKDYFDTRAGQRVTIIVDPRFWKNLIAREERNAVQVLLNEQASAPYLSENKYYSDHPEEFLSFAGKFTRGYMKREIFSKQASIGRRKRLALYQKVDKEYAFLNIPRTQKAIPATDIQGNSLNQRTTNEQSLEARISSLENKLQDLLENQLSAQKNQLGTFKAFNQHFKRQTSVKQEQDVNSNISSVKNELKEIKDLIMNVASTPETVVEETQRRISTRPQFQTKIQTSLKYEETDNNSQLDYGFDT